MPSIKKYQEVSLIDTNTVELDLDQPPVLIPMDVFITLASDNAGTVQFQVAIKGSTPDWTGIKAWGVAEKIPPITIQSGLYNLFAKASAATQKFTTSY